MDRGIRLGDAALVVSSSTRAFDFFGLPRDIRDVIYEYILTGKRVLSRSLVWSLKLRNVPSKNLLLVNSQFEKELRARTMKRRYGVYTSRHETLSYTGLIDCTTVLRSVSHMEVNIPVRRLDPNKDIETEWLNKFQHVDSLMCHVSAFFQNIRSLSINVHVLPHEDAEHFRSAVRKYGFMLFSNVARRVRMTSVKFYVCSRDKILLEDSKKLKLDFGYSSKKGWVQLIDSDPQTSGESEPIVGDSQSDTRRQISTAGT